MKTQCANMMLIEELRLVYHLKETMLDYTNIDDQMNLIKELAKIASVIIRLYDNL